MNHELKTLAGLLPPPQTPTGHERTWESIENELNLILPSDYKRFIDLYGSGCIMAAGGALASIVIYNFRCIPNVVKWVAAATNRYKDARNNGHDLPYGDYPNPGGLLAWGTDGEGDFWNWRTLGGPEDWDIVLYHFSTNQMILREGKNFTQVLIELLKHDSPLIPWPFPREHFEPPCQYAEESW